MTCARCEQQVPYRQYRGKPVLDEDGDPFFDFRECEVCGDATLCRDAECQKFCAECLKLLCPRCLRTDDETGENYCPECREKEGRLAA